MAVESGSPTWSSGRRRDGRWSPSAQGKPRRRRGWSGRPPEPRTSAIADSPGRPVTRSHHVHRGARVQVATQVPLVIDADAPFGGVDPNPWPSVNAIESPISRARSGWTASARQVRRTRSAAGRTRRVRRSAVVPGAAVAATTATMRTTGTETSPARSRCDRARPRSRSDGNGERSPGPNGALHEPVGGGRNREGHSRSGAPAGRARSTRSGSGSSTRKSGQW